MALLTSIKEDSGEIVIRFSPSNVKMARPQEKSKTRDLEF